MSKRNFAEFIIANVRLLRILRLPFFRKLEFFPGQINFVLYKIINHHQQRNLIRKINSAKIMLAKINALKVEE